MSAYIEREINYFEEIARVCREYGMKEYAEWNEQMAEWLIDLTEAEEVKEELQEELESLREDYEELKQNHKKLLDELAQRKKEVEALRIGHSCYGCIHSLDSLHDRYFNVSCATCNRRFDDNYERDWT